MTMAKVTVAPTLLTSAEATRQHTTRSGEGGKSNNSDNNNHANQKDNHSTHRGAFPTLHSDQHLQKGSDSNAPVPASASSTVQAVQLSLQRQVSDSEPGSHHRFQKSLLKQPLVVQQKWSSSTSSSSHQDDLLRSHDLNGAGSSADENTEPANSSDPSPASSLEAAPSDEEESAAESIVASKSAPPSEIPEKSTLDELPRVEGPLLSSNNPDLLLSADQPKELFQHQLGSAWAFWFDDRRSNPQNDQSRGRARDRLDSELYEKQLRQLYTFSTVEDFFRIFAYLKKPSVLASNINLSLFKAGRRPMWEDYPYGGMWIIRLRRSQKIRVSKPANGCQLRDLTRQDDGVPTSEPQRDEVPSRRGKKTAMIGNKKAKKKARKGSCAFVSSDVPGSGSSNILDVHLVDVVWESLVLACIGELFGVDDVLGVVLSSRSKEVLLCVWCQTSSSCPYARLCLGQRIQQLCVRFPKSTSMRYKDFAQSMKDFSSYRNAQQYIFTSGSEKRSIGL